MKWKIVCKNLSSHTKTKLCYIKESRKKPRFFRLTVSNVPLKGQELDIIAGSYRPFHQICKDIKTIHSPHSEIRFKRGYLTLGERRNEKGKCLCHKRFMPKHSQFTTLFPFVKEYNKK